MEKALLYEFIGTALLILMGDGVVANSILKQTKSNGAGWVNISFGWGLGVFIAVIVAGPHSGAHINPAVSFGLAVAGLFPWADVLPYTLAQIAGGFTGGVLVYIFFRSHFDITEDKEAKLAVFSTMPAISHRFNNFMAEVIGTFVLVFVILHFSNPTFEASTLSGAKIGLGSIGALPVALLVVVIGMSLGGVTGYAINPARDLGPRIAHFVLPIKGKRDSGWNYSWVPVLAPLVGAAIASLLYINISSF